LGRNVILAELDTRTTSETGRTIDISDLEKIEMFILYIETVSGISPTLDVVIENVVGIQDTESAVFEMKELSDVLATFAQQTATGTVILTSYDTGKNLGNHIRARWTLGGTNPSFKFAIIAVGK